MFQWRSIAPLKKKSVYFVINLIEDENFDVSRLQGDYRQKKKHSELQSLR